MWVSGGYCLRAGVAGRTRGGAGVEGQPARAPRGAEVAPEEVCKRTTAMVGRSRAEGSVLR